jgi:hypothetical protein
MQTKPSPRGSPIRGSGVKGNIACTRRPREGRHRGSGFDFHEALRPQHGVEGTGSRCGGVHAFERRMVRGFPTSRVLRIRQGAQGTTGFEAPASRRSLRIAAGTGAGPESTSGFDSRGGSRKVRKTGPGIEDQDDRSQKSALFQRGTVQGRKIAARRAVERGLRAAHLCRHPCASAGRRRCAELPRTELRHLPPAGLGHVRCAPSPGFFRAPDVRLHERRGPHPAAWSPARVPLAVPETVRFHRRHRGRPRLRRRSRLLPREVARGSRQLGGKREKKSAWNCRGYVREKAACVTRPTSRGDRGESRRSGHAGP